MKKRTWVFVILAVIVLLGVGYAAIANVNLNVNSSTASMTPDDGSFDVIFKAVDTFSHSGDGSAEFTRTNDHNATFTLTGFTKKGDSAVITLPFTNDSDTLKASLADAVITNSNDEYFTVTATSLAGTVLDEKGGTNPDGQLVITVTAAKTPLDTTVTTTITAQVTASPQN